MEGCFRSNQAKSAGAVVHDLTGHVVAPGFIDPSVLVEAEIGDAAGSHWNRLVHPEFDFTSNKASFGSGKRSAYAGRVHVVGRPPSKGIFRGTGTLLATTEEDGLATVRGLWKPCKAWALTVGAVGALRATLSLLWDPSLWPGKPDGCDPPPSARTLMT